LVKVALIIGITGQDGSYLAELLISKGYAVHGLRRRSSSFNTGRIDHLLDDQSSVPDGSSALKLHYGDLTDAASLSKVIGFCKPDEIYNLGAQSHVGVSFEQPDYTGQVDGLGALRVLEAVKSLGLIDKVKFYQASTSELYGDVLESPQTEATPFNPQSPYAIAKLYGFLMTKLYREAYGVFGCNGILFNHESPRRGETFVTRKITIGMSKIALGFQDRLLMGNLNSLRDWGHAREYAEMQWLMLQQDEPQDFVIATNKQHSVREWIHWSAEKVGIKLEFLGEGEKEKGVVVDVVGFAALNLSIGDCIVQVDSGYYRPAEVASLLGDASKAAELLGWTPKISAKELCFEMMDADLSRLSGGVY
jgi:GDPmannose 4,6-dehydratase